MTAERLLEDPEEFIRVLRTHWATTRTGDRLHWAEIGNEYYAGIAMDWAVTEYIRLACGRWVQGLWIAGVGARLGAERCAGCCRATGLPRGRKAPLNSPECRILLGLPADGGAAGVSPET